MSCSCLFVTLLTVSVRRLRLYVNAAAFLFVYNHSQIRLITHHHCCYACVCVYMCITDLLSYSTIVVALEEDLDKKKSQKKKWF
jgi:hypothetical protein